MKTPPPSLGLDLRDNVGAQESVKDKMAEQYICRSTSKSDKSSSPAGDRSSSPLLVSDLPFPTLEAWFKSLDEHPIHGQYNVGYSQLTEMFQDEGFVTVFDLLGLDGQQLKDLFSWGTIPIGVACRLVALAEDEKKRLMAQGKSRKKARHS